MKVSWEKLKTWIVSYMGCFTAAWLRQVSQTQSVIGVGYQVRYIYSQAVHLINHYFRSMATGRSNACCTHTASVCSELRKRPCSRLSLYTSELQVRTKTFILHLRPKQCQQRLWFVHSLTWHPQSRGRRRGSGRICLVQTWECGSCSSARVGSGTLRSGRWAKIPTAQ